MLLFPLWIKIPQDTNFPFPVFAIKEEKMKAWFLNTAKQGDSTNPIPSSIFT